MKATYEAGMTMREARDHYFAVNGFGPTGGYDDTWVDFKLGPIPFPFPNTPGRVRTVKFHDVHHILTGYDTDTVGEFEISAWEIGAGCKDFWTAWQINLGGMFAGLLVAPKRIYRAFMRGRRSSTVYGESYEALLASKVEDERAKHVPDAAAEPTAKDVALFALAGVAGAVLGTLFLAITVPMVPVGLVMSAWLKGKRAKENAAAA
jgi:hypothetical protein